MSAGSGGGEGRSQGPDEPGHRRGETWPLGGDIIVEADGVPTPTVNKLSDVIAKHKPGDTIKLVVYRGEHEEDD